MLKSRTFVLAVIAVSLTLAGLPLSLLGDLRFLKVFPESPVIQDLPYKGHFSYTQVYAPSGSQWAPALDEQEVFFASVKHDEDSDNRWEIRVGKGGQLYSIRGPFGESQAPQTQPNARWVDQVFQLVAVNRELNKSTPRHAYFIHQAGAYLDDPILRSTFYSPMLASGFDAEQRAVFALNWGQQAHIPAVNPSGLLYYERLKDLGSGVIEITYVVYNFGRHVIDYLNTPWGGVRKSVLPVTLMSTPNGGFRPVMANWDEEKWTDLNISGGWIAWTQDSNSALSPTLALVAGTDGGPTRAYQSAPARFRYGTAWGPYDFEAVELDPFVNLAPGNAMFFRVYLVVGFLWKVQPVANTLSRTAGWGPATFDEQTAELVPVYGKTIDSQRVLTAQPQTDRPPLFYTFSQPVTNAVPLFVVRAAASRTLRLSVDPCALCTMVRVGEGEMISKPYDGNVEYVEFLGYALPAEYARSRSVRYGRMTDLVKDRSYFPNTSQNNGLRVVLARSDIDKRASSVYNSQSRAISANRTVEVLAVK